MFYVSVLDHSGQRSVMALGPFRTHGQALKLVPTVKRFVLDSGLFPRHDTAWARFGTCRRATDHPAGRFNNELGYAGPGSLP